MGIKKSNWIISADGRTHVMILRKFGNWDVGYITYENDSRVRLMVRGQWYGENPIIYNHNWSVGYDNPYKIPKSIKEYIYSNARQIYELQKELNNNRMKAKGIPDYMSGYM